MKRQKRVHFEDWARGLEWKRPAMAEFVCTPCGVVFRSYGEPPRSWRRGGVGNVDWYCASCVGKGYWWRE